MLVYDPSHAVVRAGLATSPTGSCTLTTTCAKASTPAFVLADSYPK